ncbi:Acg family FMN-binding oxidoreductase [Actinokineospora guangxiensis]|uniref:Acg family FMN-binding oxidoreductase n=1 Tax=Actinokineospora guangxiensis TaxID=1490288 RepID=A0ABW0EK95_9PSEU
MNPLPPALGLAPEQVGAALSAAATAPSLHNSQPWRFAVHPDRIELLAALSARLPATDPDDRELRLGCGAALFTLRVALESQGVRPLVSISFAEWPGDDPDRPLAVVRYGGRARPRPEITALAQAIPRRRTVRSPFSDVAVPSSHRARLLRAAGDERCWLHTLDLPADRDRLRAMVAKAHRRQSDNPAFADEMAAWTGHDGARDDGVPLTASGPRPEPHDEWTLRDFGAGRSRVRVPGKDFESSPLLLVLQSYSDGPAEQIQAGQALQRVLLTATSLGLSVSLLSQPIEVPEVRGELRRLLGNRLHPQAIVRVGYGTPGRATPRRPLSDLVIVHPVIAHPDIAHPDIPQEPVEGEMLC